MHQWYNFVRNFAKIRPLFQKLKWTHTHTQNNRIGLFFYFKEGT